jgi:hypothetical protein
MAETSVPRVQKFARDACAQDRPCRGREVLADRTYWGARLDHCSVIIERAEARGELPAGTDHRLVFELLVGAIHARILLTPDNLDNIKTAAIVDAVLNGVARAD